MGEALHSLKSKAVRIPCYRAPHLAELRWPPDRVSAGPAGGGAVGRSRLLLHFTPFFRMGHDDDSLACAENVSRGKLAAPKLPPADSRHLCEHSVDLARG